jgi:cytochrome c-type biogenesis protein CcmH/NrfG
MWGGTEMAEPGNNVQWRLQSLEKRMDTQEKRVEQYAELHFQLREVKGDVREILRRERERDQGERESRLQQTRDRKADRKWQLTVMAAWASAIIAAIAIIVPLLVSG